MKKFIVILTCCLFLVSVVRPVPVHAASFYEIPEGADPNRYLGQTYPTFGDFLQFACAHGTDNISYGVFATGSGSSRVASFRFSIVDSGTTFYVYYLVPTGSSNSTDLSLLTLDTPAGTYAGAVSLSSSFTTFFNDYFADFPNITQYSAVQDSIGHFKVVLFLLVGFMFIMAGRRSVS